MSMFTLCGEVVHVYRSPEGVNKKTGEEYGGQDKVQIMGDIPMKGGETRKELISLTTDQGATLEKMQGKMVTCPVSFFSSGRSVAFYIPEGHKIKILQPQTPA